jgi:hypothetical protein
MNIDKNDIALVIEAKLTSVKNFIFNEMNDFIDALDDLSFDSVFKAVKIEYVFFDFLFISRKQFQCG